MPFHSDLHNTFLRRMLPSSIHPPPLLISNPQPKTHQRPAKQNTTLPLPTTFSLRNDYNAIHSSTMHCVYVSSLKETVIYHDHGDLSDSWGKEGKKRASTLAISSLPRVAKAVSTVALGLLYIHTVEDSLQLYDSYKTGGRVKEKRKVA